MPSTAARCTCVRRSPSSSACSTATGALSARRTWLRTCALWYAAAFAFFYVQVALSLLACFAWCWYCFCIFHILGFLCATHIAGMKYELLVTEERLYRQMYPTAKTCIIYSIIQLTPHLHTCTKNRWPITKRMPQTRTGS